MKPQHLSEDIHKQLAHVTAHAGVNLARFPDFLLIGPPRTGTTWVHHHLSRHPGIFMPKEKEMYYFSTLGKPTQKHFRFSSLEEYLAALDDTVAMRLRKVAGCAWRSRRFYSPVVRGEATASYASLPGEVIREICLINPDIKAIMLLRNPIERTWSHAKKDIMPHVDRSTGVVPEAELDKFFRASGQLENARYAGLIRNWEEFLKPGHLLVDAFSRIADAPEDLLAGIQRFLGVSEGTRYVDRGALRERINRTNDDPIPPAMQERLTARLSVAVEEYEALLRTRVAR